MLLFKLTVVKYHVSIAVRKQKYSFYSSLKVYTMTLFY